jgi:hypothetical protein
VQGDALRLKPWQEPPCVVSEDGPERDHAAQKLVRRMLAVGVSRYDPHGAGAGYLAGLPSMPNIGLDQHKQILSQSVEARKNGVVSLIALFSRERHSFASRSQ